MFIELNFKSGKPAYLQIMEQVKYASAMGQLRPGDPLPSIRHLAERLRINRNTVAKAYSRLEQEGIVKTVRGKGVFLSEKESPFGKKMRSAILADAVDTAIVQAHHFGIGRSELLDLMNKRFNEYVKRRDQQS